MSKTANHFLHASKSLTWLSDKIAAGYILKDDEVRDLAHLAQAVLDMRDNAIRTLRNNGMKHEDIAALFKISASRSCQITKQN